MKTGLLQALEVAENDVGVTGVEYVQLTTDRLGNKKPLISTTFSSALSWSSSDKLASCLLVEGLASLRVQANQVGSTYKIPLEEQKQCIS